MAGTSSVFGSAVVLVALVVAGGCQTVHDRYQVNVDLQKNQETIKSVGVLEFEWKAPEVHLQEGMSQGYSADTGAAVSDIVSSELMRLNRYTIRERSDLKRILEEHQLEISDVMAKGDYRLIGKLAQVDAVVVGRVAAANVVSGGPISHLEAGFTCRCVETKTGDVLWSIGGDKTVEYAVIRNPTAWLRTLTEELVQQLQEKLEHPATRAKREQQAR